MKSQALFQAKMCPIESGPWSSVSAKMMLGQSLHAGPAGGGGTQGPLEGAGAGGFDICPFGRHPAVT